MDCNEASLVAQTVKNPPAKAGDLGSIPGLGRFPGEGNGIHSRILAWRIPWTEEPDGLQVIRLAPLSMGFSRQESCSGLLFPSRGDLSNPGIKPESPAWQVDSLPLSNQGSIWKVNWGHVTVPILQKTEVLRGLLTCPRSCSSRIKTNIPDHGLHLLAFAVSPAPCW